MPIGRLSIRINSRNRLHHLWRNRGTWWIHYVLHFAGRKRRRRRTLGTTSVTEAIRLRDEIFARIERDGEEVPERGQKKPPEECEMKPLNYRLVSRSSELAHADRIIAECEGLTACSLAASEDGRRLWRRAAKLFTFAADIYLSNGFSLLAIAAHEGAAKCFEALGMPQELKRCRWRIDAIPTYGEEGNQ